MQATGKAKQDKTLLWVTIGAFLSLFIYGFIDNLKGVTLPPIITDLSFSYSAGGIIQQGAYFGFLCATLLTGIMVSWIGHIKTLLIGAVCLITGMLVYSVSSQFGLLAFAMIIIGLGLGTLDLGGIFLIIDYRQKEKGKFLNLSAFFHGLASMTAPLFAGLILAAGLTWRHVYQIGVFFIIIFMLYFILIRKSLNRSHQASSLPSLRAMASALRDKGPWVFYFLIFCYESVEIGYAVWIGEFLQNWQGLSQNLSILMLSAFFFCLMIGRLIGGLVVEKLGYLRMLLYASISAFVCLLLGTFGPAASLFFLPLTGLFLSVIFPTTTAVASLQMKSSGHIQMGLFFMFAGLGGMLGSWMIGVLSDLSTLQLGFGSLTFMTFTIIILVIYQMGRIKTNYEELTDHIE